MKKEVKIFNEKFSEVLTDIPGLRFLDFEEEGVAVKSNALEINGMDGVLLGPSNFGPFNLILNFSFKGKDSKDLRLLKQKLREILFKREPYFVWHSDMPGRKYAVYCEENTNNTLTNAFATFSIKFLVFKGYSESMRDTGHYRNDDDTWQFESGVTIDDDIKYLFNSTGFKVYNGSSDTINPLLRHNLSIRISMNAPNGFKLWNRTTDDEFYYYKPISSDQAFVIKGVNPLLNGKRVGHNSNWQWITLKPGYNNFQIMGDNISDVTIEFIFNFIYR